MKKITGLTIALVSIGVIFAILVGYNYFTTVHVISKQRVVDLATRYCQCTSQQIGNYTIGAKLLQAKLSNHISLIIDENTMSVVQTLPQVWVLPAYNFHEDQLFWYITIITHVKGDTYHEWHYYFDATNGNLLTSSSGDCIGNC